MAKGTPMNKYLYKFHLWLKLSILIKFQFSDYNLSTQNANKKIKLTRIRICPEGECGKKYAYVTHPTIPSRRATKNTTPTTAPTLDPPSSSGK